MSRQAHWLNGALVTAVLAAGSLVASSAIVLAVSSDPPPKPKPKIDCSKTENQGKAACKNKLKELSDDDLFHAGYWLARKGDYQLALHYLEQARNKSDPRVLTYIGFATRKLGNWDRAMEYYTRALEINPNFTVARGYLGEAHLERGERSQAEAQLSEIAQRCGTACEEWKELSTALAKAERRT